MLDAVHGMNSNGIAARTGFCPMTAQPEYNHSWITQPETLRAYNEVMYLPLTVAPADVPGIVGLLEDYVRI